MEALKKWSLCTLVFIVFLFNIICIFPDHFLSFLCLFACLGFCCVAFQRPKGIEEGGTEGAKHEEIVHEAEEVKEERINENGQGKEIAQTCKKEKLRESGDKEKTHEIPEQGQEKSQWNKEDLQKQFSQDNGR